MKTGEGLFIGIDLGGTNVRAGAVTPQGAILAWSEASIEAQRGPQAGLQRITDLIRQTLNQVGAKVPLAIGIGSTGPINRRLGSIQNPYTLPTWEDVPIVSPLAEHFGVPVALENDADAAALGEAWVGAGRGFRRVAMVTVGTGIGSALVYNGEIYRGINDEHPEGGHVLIDPNGPECYCGGRGCWEVLASGPAIARRARELAQQVPTTMLDLAGGDLEAIDARIVTQAAQAGDAAALQVIDETARYLALGLVNLLIFYLPDLVVLGGGVMRSFSLFEPTIRKTIAQHSVVAPLQTVRLEAARLGNQAGVIGAARAAMQLLEDAQP